MVPLFPLSKDEVIHSLIRSYLVLTETMVNVGSGAMIGIPLGNPIVSTTSSKNLGPRLVIPFRIIPEGNSVLAQGKGGIVINDNFVIIPIEAERSILNTGPTIR